MTDEGSTVPFPPHPRSHPAPLPNASGRVTRARQFEPVSPMALEQPRRWIIISCDYHFLSCRSFSLDIEIDLTTSRDRLNNQDLIAESEGLAFVRFFPHLPNSIASFRNPESTVSFHSNGNMAILSFLRKETERWIQRMLNTNTSPLSMSCNGMREMHRSNFAAIASGHMGQDPLSVSTGGSRPNDPSMHEGYVGVKGRLRTY